MGKTYCGKICSECEYRELLDCSGCEEYSREDRECEIADCCKNKWHEICGDCKGNSDCEILMQKYNIPRRRICNRKIDGEILGYNRERAGILGKWLWVLFWLVVPFVTASFMTNSSIIKIMPMLYIPGKIIEFAAYLSYGIILIKLSSQDSKYRISGICMFILIIVNLLFLLILKNREIRVISFLISILTIIISFIGEYNEFKANSNVLLEIDNVLSGKWLNLWKWNFGILTIMILSNMLLPVMPMILATIVFATTIASIIIKILKLIYLYRTAQIFRDRISDDI